MNRKENHSQQKQKVIYVIFWGVTALAIFIVLSGMGYSDGDDAYFYHYSTTMGFFEYLSWRYRTWVGRMAGEALVYITFNLGLWFWRVVNAVMLVLLPIGILRLGCKAAGYKGFFAFLEAEQEKKRLRPTADGAAKMIWDTIKYPVFLCAGYLLMSVMTVGYSAVWVNGSIFYTWTFTAGVWAMMPLADSAFDTGAFSEKQLFYAIPCSVIAAMSIEQMGAVLTAFEVLTICCLALHKKKIPVAVTVQLLVTAAAFGVLFAAPGNEIRVQTEIVSWMPEYENLTFGSHLFMTLQWLLSSFANEGKAFFIGIWAAGILLLGKSRKADVMIYQIVAGIFAAAALLPYMGIRTLSEMGLGGLDIEACITELPTWQAMGMHNRAAFFWWMAAVLFTLVFLWKVTEHSVFISMVYLGGIASEAILFFSPTMYASGARIYYLTDLMYLFILLWLFLKLDGEKKKNGFVLGLTALGVINFLSQITVLALKL